MIESQIAEHFASHQRVIGEAAVKLAKPAAEVARVTVEALRDGRKVIAFGNGGSAAQASHLVGELLGRFHLTRQPFPAVALSSDPGTVTCISNDFGYDALFERQAQALAQPGDVAFGFTTSGRSENVRRGLAAARARRDDRRGHGRGRPRGWFGRSRHRRAERRDGARAGGSLGAPARLVHPHRRGARTSPVVVHS